MSYQVLARKWRPRNFSSLVGQEHVVRALNHALTENRLHHAYLFTGTRGVGKTTIARILAKSLNCELGVTAHPCGQCLACQEIDAGRFVDLLEVDAATNTRVEEMRQLLENAVYAPTRGRYKVYVIDEVHMLSTSAFNAMLKTLEEPPEHVKFILATTDPQKIPVTVLSRCLQFNLKQMVPAAITEYLTHLLNAEGVPYEQPALALLARSAAGSMRDALSLLDQAIAHGAGRVDVQQVQAMLGTVDVEAVIGILEAFCDNQLPRVLDVVEALDRQSISFAQTLEDMASFLTQIQLLQLAPGYSGGDAAADVVMQGRLAGIAGRLSPEAVQLAYQIVIQGKQELPLAPDDRTGFTMVMMRLLAFVPREIVKSEGVAVGVVPPKQNVVRPTSPVTKPQEQAVPSSVGRASSGDRSPVWRDMLLSLDLSGMAKNLAQNCELRTWELPSCLLRLAPSAKHLLMKPAQDKLQSALSEYAGQPVALKIEVAENETDTPAVVMQKETHAKAERAVQAITADSFVQEVQATFGATVLPGSIKPL